MRISVITCTRDSARWLGENIASIAAQTHADVEMVFVDGGSTDDTLSLIEATPGRVVLIRDSIGLSASMNAGARAASGDVLMHLHSDDYLAAPDALARVADTFARTACQWLYGQCRYDENGGVHSPRTLRWNPRRLRTRGNMVPHPAVAIRRSLFESVGGFDPAFKCCMDYDLWLRLAERADPVQIDDYLSVFRVHGAAISSAQAPVCMAEDERLRMRHVRGPLERLEARVSIWRERRRLRRAGLIGGCGGDCAGDCGSDHAGDSPKAGARDHG